MPSSLVKANISEVHITSIFKVKVYTKQETTIKKEYLAACFMLVYCLAYSLTMKMVAIFL
jgi:hypothetical protein